MIRLKQAGCEREARQRWHIENDRESRMLALGLMAHLDRADSLLNRVSDQDLFFGTSES